MAVLLFNIFRFFIGRHDTPEGPEYYLMSETLVLEQIFFPIGMLIIYGISGYYNDTLEKSRLSELNQTVSGAVIRFAGNLFAGAYQRSDVDAPTRSIY